MNVISEKNKRKIKKKIIAAILGAAMPLMTIFAVPMLLVVILSGGQASTVPAIDETNLSELQRVATECGIGWDEVLAYATVKYNNDFEDVDIEALVAQFLVVQVDEFEVTETVVKKIVEAPDGKPKTVSVTETQVNKIGSSVYETEQSIRSYAYGQGVAQGSSITQVMQRLRQLGESDEYDVYVTSKEIFDFYDELNGDQRDWYNALIAENIMEQAFGTYFELPTEIVVDSKGFFAWPVPSVTRVTSPFGWREDPVYGGRGFHKGIDIAQSGCLGEPVIATAAGTVIQTQSKSTGYGNVVLIEHVDEDGATWRTRYAHLNQISVSPGQAVQRGTVVGAVGSTGKSTGPHLHYEIIYQGTPVDPLLFYQ